MEYVSVFSVMIVILAVICFVLAFLIAYSGRNVRRNREFAAFAALTAVWMLANFTGINYKSYSFAQYFIIIDFLLGPILAYLLWRFTQTLLAETTIIKHGKRIDIALFISSVLASGIVLLPMCVNIIYIDSRTEISYGSLFEIYAGAILITALLALVNTIRAFRKSIGRLHSHISMMLLGFTVYVVSLAIPNLLVPILTDDEAINLVAGDLSYIGIVLFVLSTYYAIARYRLFDVRLVIVRIIGYAITVAIVASLYSVAIVVVTARIAGVDILNYNALIATLFATTLVVSITFHRLQRLVTRTTERLFYQHTYSTRTVLEELSDSLLHSNDIPNIMQRSTRILGDALRPNGMQFILVGPERNITTSYSVQGLKTDTTSLDCLYAKPSIEVYERDDTIPQACEAFMQANNLELILRIGKPKDPVGFIFFGHKQSGGMYSNQDVQLLKISSHNISVTIENAQRYEQISHFAETLQEEVTSATKRLRQANEKLKSVDKLKDDFIHMASHQFRTPAGSIRQALRMINGPLLSPKEKKEMLKLAEVNSEQLVTIVSTMLNISRIQAGKFTITKERTDIATLVQKVLLSTTIVADQKETKLNFIPPHEPVFLNVDATKLNEAMKNYVENAIKYSPSGSIVDIRLVIEENKVRFEVSDSGMGVPENERSHLFGKFYRAQNAREQQPDGNGIGLYVVRMIAEHHGGEAYYTPLTKGSLFGFWLPADKK